MSSQTTDKGFAFSYSRIKEYENCPRRYYETQVAKTTKDTSDLLEEGDKVHKAMAKALMDGTPLPLKYRQWQKWIDRVAQTPGEMLIEDEARWACTRDFKPVPFFAPTVWGRCIVDVYKHAPPVGYIVDWKAGKSANVDPVQMTLMALMAFIHFPEIEIVKGFFIWLGEDDSTSYVIDREDAVQHWTALIPRVKRLEKATKDGFFPPTPNRFCERWCPCTNCEHNGSYEG